MTVDRHGSDRKGWFPLRPSGQRLLAILAAVVCAMLMPIPVSAQDSGSGASYITPFPDNDVYRLQVFGDSIAEGLLSGIVETFAGDTRLQVQRSRHALGGILRNEFIDEVQTIDSNLSRTPMHIVLVMVGLYDRYPWRPQGGNRRVPVGSDEWKAEYARRVDRLMKIFKARNAALYWVGLPIMRRPEFSDDAQMINEIVRERAYVNGQKFIDLFSQFADEKGVFNAYGPEIDGKIRLLREADGIHFTQVGNRKLAHFVERDLRRDITQARSDRAVPLAGTEVEQKRVRQMRMQAEASAAPKGGGPQVKDAKGPTATDPVVATTAKGASRITSADAASGEVRADNSRITVKVANAGGKEEAIAIDILRPALPASVVAAVTRRESSDKASQVGDSITSEISGGLTIVSSVSTSADGATVDRRRLPATQTPYYRVLVKGEQLQPKPGRADDFSWPRPEAPAVDPAMLEQLTNPSSSIRLAPAKSRRSPSPNG
ncbi:MAG: DUF459 domain-containing protein [Sphingomonadales bacterium]|nr:DUF459 domain-containing protein [Sphingomonadales bacterium]